jgi:hypothetical protein
MQNKHQNVVDRLTKAGCSPQHAEELLAKVDLAGSAEQIFERAVDLMIAETIQAAEEEARGEANKPRKQARSLSLGSGRR